MKIPVLLTVFNRKDTALKALESIRVYQPEKLYVAADGHRTHKEGEEQACADTRQAVLDAIDWPCDVRTLFREENLGCAKAMFGAISWFLEQEEWGIICEDDIVLSQDFYKMCEVLLPMYKDDDRIMQITSQFYGPHCEVTDTYTFERRPFIWGWATWRRSWFKYMDMEMSGWPQFNPLRMLPNYGWFQTLMMWYYWHRAFKQQSTNSSWANRWHLAADVNELLCICPKTNLGLNVGIINGGGTHYTEGGDDPYAHLKMGKLQFPLKHPSEICLDKQQLDIDKDDFWRIRMIGAKKKIKRFFGK